VDEKQIAALLVNAAATVFAAQMETTRHHVIKPTLASGGTEVLIVWREMTKSVHEALQTEKKQ
jgi:hypothetical protein